MWTTATTYSFTHFSTTSDSDILRLIQTKLVRTSFYRVLVVLSPFQASRFAHSKASLVLMLTFLTKHILWATLLVNQRAVLYHGAVAWRGLSDDREFEAELAGVEVNYVGDDAAIRPSHEECFERPQDDVRQLRQEYLANGVEYTSLKRRFIWLQILLEILF
ncbi:hypothetical protein F444_11263 [Phytophthora nicotianae P1976]|uniref:Uncharacterized protein n=1 Tax=Phytophthora nicotianae P1976 TaxID=1317066 RepID=A0A081A1G0_PHYNI|nr:hypothetical protein F444_11263 [Phytophthora nicotianae P1976]